MVNPQAQTYEEKAYSTQTQAWKWEKKHWLLAIAGGCVVLWWFGSSMLEISLFKKSIELLPVIGGICFAADSIIKLTQ